MLEFYQAGVFAVNILVHVNLWTHAKHSVGAMGCIMSPPNSHAEVLTTNVTAFRHSGESN